MGSATGWQGLRGELVSALSSAQLARLSWKTAEGTMWQRWLSVRRTDRSFTRVKWSSGVGRGPEHWDRTKDRVYLE